jgi:hypothetical protein
MAAFRWFVLLATIALCGALFLTHWSEIGAVLYGQVHQARVEQKWESRGFRGTREFYIRYSYEAGGEPQFREQIVAEEQYEKIPTPSRQAAAPTIPVYTRGSGSRYREIVLMPGESVWWPVKKDLLCSLPLLLLGVYWVFLRGWREKSLYRWGTPHQGVIFKLRINRSQWARSSVREYLIDYEFEHPRLGICRHEMEVDEASWQRAREGEMVTVLVDPHDARESLIYECGEFECK